MCNNYVSKLCSKPHKAKNCFTHPAGLITSAASSTPLLYVVLLVITIKIIIRSSDSSVIIAQSPAMSHNDHHLDHPHHERPYPHTSFKTATITIDFSVRRSSFPSSFTSASSSGMRANSYINSSLEENEQPKKGKK